MYKHAEMRAYSFLGGLEKYSDMMFQKGFDYLIKVQWIMNELIMLNRRLKGIKINT